MARATFAIVTGVERVFASSDPLDARVDRIFACDERYRAPVAERILPDGAIHLIFNLGDRPSGDRGADLAAMAMGATCAPTRIVLAGTIDQVCVRVGIGRAAAVLGVPARAVTDHGVSLHDLWGVAAAETLEQLHAARTARARIALVASILRERVGKATPPAPAVGEAMRRIAACGGRVRIPALAADLGVGERRLQQLFLAQIGLSPKVTCRLARFRAVIARWRREPRRSWTETALEVGFYDQAHLVNELKAFTGLTPGELARQHREFGFLQDGSGAAGSQ